MTQSDDQLMQELLQTFFEEAAEHLQTMNQDLLQLERQPDADRKSALIQEVFRSAHSLKGASRAVGLKPIETLAHAMEDILKLARDGEKSLDATICDALYNTLDGIQGVLNNQAVDVTTLVNNLNLLLDQPHAQLVPDQNTPVDAGSDEDIDTSNGNASARFNENDESIRVIVSKLDALMAQTGELASTRINAEQRISELQTIRHNTRRIPRLWHDVRSKLGRLPDDNDNVRDLVEVLDVYQSEIEELLSEISLFDTHLNRDALRLGMVADRLQNEMRRVRMVPFKNLTPFLNRTVRDAAHVSGNQASIVIEGGHVELDKKVLELLKDPLLHLVRNAVGHGIESPSEREQSDKSPEGLITITVNQRGSEAHVTVSDNGRGFQLDALKQLDSARQSGTQSDDDLIALAFMPGITTANNVNALSGRGIGLDVVRQQVENLQGRISVDNRPGHGVSIHMIVPVSLAMTRVLLVSVGSNRFALPLAAVEKIVSPEKTFSVEGQVMLSVDDKPLPLVTLSHLLYDRPIESDEPLVIVLGSAEQRVAIMVDDVLTEQELAVKAFNQPIKRARNLAGAALLGNGEPIVVLNVADLVKSSKDVRDTHFIKQNTEKMGDETASQQQILVVDDSITTRTLEKNILKAAGYWVETATDGVEALHALKKHDIQLVVADVEMPNMDGITLTQSLRDNEQYENLPIILVTSLESTADRERGMMAGANAYIVKRGFNQGELLSTIRQFL